MGVGLNVHAQQVDEAATGVASLDELDPDTTPAATLARVVPALVAALRRFDEGGLAPFADRFAARDLLKGLTVAGAGADAEVIGEAAGIGRSGALVLRTAGGLREVESGEWRVRIAERVGSPC